MENNQISDSGIGRHMIRLMDDLRKDPELWQKVLAKAEQLNQEAR